MATVQMIKREKKCSWSTEKIIARKKQKNTLGLNCIRQSRHKLRSLGNSIDWGPGRACTCSIWRASACWTWLLPRGDQVLNFSLIRWKCPGFKYIYYSLWSFKQFLNVLIVSCTLVGMFKYCDI